MQMANSGLSVVDGAKKRAPRGVGASPRLHNALEAALARKNAPIVPGATVAVLDADKKTRAEEAPFTERQADLPGIIGLPLEHIVAWREKHLQEGRDWARSGEVRWTQEAVAVLRKALRIPANAMPSGPQQTAPRSVRGLLPLPDGICRTVLKAWAPTKNRHILMAHLSTVQPRSARDLVRVRVTDCNTFRRGMAVPARHQQADLWEWDRVLARELKAGGAR